MQLESREEARRRARRHLAGMMRERLKPPTPEEWEAIELERDGRLVRLENWRRER